MSNLVALKPASGGLPSTGILPDASAGSSVDWYNRQLIDNTAVPGPYAALDWFNRDLIDNADTQALSWKYRTLNDATDGSTVATWADYFNVSKAGAASKPGLGLTGAIFTGGSGTTTFPLFLIQPTGTTAATNWSTSGTAFGLNAPTGFVGDFANFKVAGVTAFKLDYAGFLTAGKALFQNAANSTTAFEIKNVDGTAIFGVDTTNRFIQLGGDAFGVSTSTGKVYLYNGGDIVWSTGSTASGGPSTPGPSIGCCTGTPEGAVAATVGSIRIRADGGANTTFYVKESGAGNTGWVAK